MWLMEDGNTTKLGQGTRVSGGDELGNSLGAGWTRPELGWKILAGSVLSVMAAVMAALALCVWKKDDAVASWQAQPLPYEMGSYGSD